MGAKENQVKNSILEYLHTMGIVAWPNNTGAVKYESHGTGRFVRYGHKGSGDILGVLPGGRFLSIECKTTSGRASSAQTDFMLTVNRAGGLAFIARSIDEVEKILTEEIDKCS